MRPPQPRGNEGQKGGSAINERATETGTPVQERERRERRRKYKRAWEKTHYHTLSTRVTHETARAFEKVCKRDRMTVYAVLKGLVEDVLEHYG